MSLSGAIQRFFVPTRGDVGLDQLVRIVHEQQVEIGTLREEFAPLHKQVEHYRSGLPVVQDRVDDLAARVEGEISGLRKEVATCREEVAALCECLADAGLLSPVKFVAKLHRRRCLEMVLHTYEIALTVGLFAGPTALRATGTVSRASAAAMSKVWPALTELCLSYIYVCGGRPQGSGKQPLDLVERFSPWTGTWEALPTMTQRREGASAGILEGKLYICGGFNGTSTLNSVERLDAVNSRWDDMPPMQIAREGASAGVLGGKLYICGGSDGRGQHFSSAERFEPSVGCWEDLPPMAKRRAWTTAGAIGGRLYVCGGYDGHHLLSSAERFEPMGGSSPYGMWQEVAPMSERRNGAAAAALSGKLYVCGGAASIGGASSSVERFDPEVGSWETAQPMSGGRCHAAAVAVSGRLYVFGGYSDGQRTCSADRFNPGTGLWTELPPMSERRSRSAVAAVLG
mmetsp:Transcript_60231/g.107345  ORF Transcript_60231/g.107345 Transcript_60231/m.107345 type:complete len:457 (+) Transcript_60231:48-1418(+)